MVERSHPMYWEDAHFKVHPDHYVIEDGERLCLAEKFRHEEDRRSETISKLASFHSSGANDAPHVESYWLKIPQGQELMHEELVEELY